MKSIFSVGLILFALSFCGLGDRLKGLTGDSNSNSNTPSSTPSSVVPTVTGAEKPTLTGSQQAIIDGGTETKWDEQGIAWTLPKGWTKMNVTKESFNYKSPDLAFLLVNIAVLPDSFPMDVSLKAYHEQALDQLKNGKYEQVRLLEIDGIPGVEFTEAPPKGKDDPRRHQWIAYRTYLGQKQQVNVMTSTSGTNFEKHSDDFPAILYSMKVVK